MGLGGGSGDDRVREADKGREKQTSAKRSLRQRPSSRQTQSEGERPSETEVWRRDREALVLRTMRDVRGVVLPHCAALSHLLS